MTPLFYAYVTGLGFTGLMTMRTLRWRGFRSNMARLFLALVMVGVVAPDPYLLAAACAICTVLILGELS